MIKPAIKHCTLVVALALAGTSAAQTTTGTTDPHAASAGTTVTTAVPPPGQARVADKFAAPFITMAGSPENAVALANALRTGTAASLTYTSVDAKGVATTTTLTITPPTKPMGWGNVSHSLALAQFALNQAGITQPTGAQLQTALLGGSFTTADGKTIVLAGVLQQRADGMGWGRIAQSYGTTMGAVNRGIKAPATVVATSTPTATPSATPKAASARGVTTAGGTAASSGHGAKGLTTAAGATHRANHDGIVNAANGSGGNGNAYGRGVVTASGASVGAASSVTTGGGSSSGVVTGAGGASGVVTADPGHGSGGNSGHGKGKGGG